MKKYLGILAGLILTWIMPGLLWADAGSGFTDVAQKVGGTIPVIRKIFVSETGTTTSELFSSITVEDYRAGFKQTDEGRFLLTVLSNAPWKVMVKAEFAPVGKYLKPANDLLLRIQDKAIVAQSGTGGRFNPNFVDFGSLSNEEQILWIDRDGGDHCSANADYKILLSPLKDIPGDYKVTVTYTISAP